MERAGPGSVFDFDSSFDSERKSELGAYEELEMPPRFARGGLYECLYGERKVRRGSEG